MDDKVFQLNATVFFLYLLPPIIFESGYFMPNRHLFENVGSVMTFAVFGTVFNTIAIGLTIVGCSGLGWFGFEVKLTFSFYAFLGCYYRILYC